MGKKLVASRIDSAVADLDYAKKKDAADDKTETEKLKKAHEIKKEALKDTVSALSDKMATLETNPALKAIGQTVRIKAKQEAAKKLLKAADAEESKQLKLQLAELDQQSSELIKTYASTAPKDDSTDTPVDSTGKDSTEKNSTQETDKEDVVDNDASIKSKISELEKANATQQEHIVNYNSTEDKEESQELQGYISELGQTIKDIKSELSKLGGKVPEFPDNVSMKGFGDSTTNNNTTTTSNNEPVKKGGKTSEEIEELKKAAALKKSKAKTELEESPTVLKIKDKIKKAEDNIEKYKESNPDTAKQWQEFMDAQKKNLAGIIGNESELTSMLYLIDSAIVELNRQILETSKVGNNNILEKIQSIKSNLEINPEYNKTNEARTEVERRIKQWESAYEQMNELNASSIESAIEIGISQLDKDIAAINSKKPSIQESETVRLAMKEASALGGMQKDPSQIASDNVSKLDKTRALMKAAGLI